MDPSQLTAATASALVASKDRGRGGRLRSQASLANDGYGVLGASAAMCRSPQATGATWTDEQDGRS